MSFILAWVFGLGGVIKAAFAVITPVLAVVAGWVMAVIDWLVRRFVREVKALFDVFPFIVLTLVFLSGGLYFHNWSQVKERLVSDTKVVVVKVKEKAGYKSRPKVNRRSPTIWDQFQHPLGK